MTATASMISQVRRWTKEPLPPSSYVDADIKAIIETYPVVDELGTDPYVYDRSTNPPTKVPAAGWIATYDLHRAAAHIWEEKVANLADTVDIPVQGPTQGTIRHTQPRDFAVAQARYHRARAYAGTITLIASSKKSSS